LLLAFFAQVSAQQCLPDSSHHLMHKSSKTVKQSSKSDVVTFPSFEKSLKHAVLLPEIDMNCTSVESTAAFNPSQGNMG
jgi:hypothetical protein